MFHFQSIRQRLARELSVSPQVLVRACLLMLSALPGLLKAQDVSPDSSIPVALDVVPKKMDKPAHFANTVNPAEVFLGGTGPEIHLGQMFEQAWAQHPLQKALAERHAANQSAQLASQAWSAQPAALELRTQTDSIGTHQGAEELELGVSVPLWLPEQRKRSQQLALAQAQLIDASLSEARLALAGTLREAWWEWQRAEVALQSATDQANASTALLADVKKRVAAGDLAPSDEHQAAGAWLLAEGARHQAKAQQSRAGQALSAWGVLPESLGHPLSKEPEATQDLAAPMDVDAHPVWQAASRQFYVARESAALASSQVQANPELTVGAIHSRDQRGESTQRALIVGLRVPLGKSAAQVSQAIESGAQATEAQAKLSLVRTQLEAAFAGAKQRLTWARAQHETAVARARLTQETQEFFEKSFALGETDTPTRLRIALEAQEASRQAALTQIDVAAAASALRQAAGLLPQ